MEGPTSDGALESEGKRRAICQPLFHPTRLNGIASVSVTFQIVIKCAWHVSESEAFKIRPRIVLHNTALCIAKHAVRFKD